MMLTKTKFLSVLKTKEPSGSIDLMEIEKAISEFPYFSNLHILKALSLHESSNVGLQKAIESAAARTISRRRLKFLIEGPLVLDFDWLEKENVEEEDNVGESESLENENQDLNYEIFQEVVADNKVETNEEEVVLANEISAYSREKLGLIPESGPIYISPPNNDFGFSFIKVSKAKKEKEKKRVAPQPFDISALVSKKPIKSKPAIDAIDRFLEISPGIFSPRIDFGNQEPLPDLAASSVSLSEEIITENMALIYLKQKNFQKALDIYKKLMLKFPEKSAYFAALIKNLEYPIL